MATLPHRFLPGEIARSQEINANFNYIMSLLGTLSTTGRISPPGELAMGPRNNVLLTNKHDTGPAGNRFFQVGWNVNWTNIPGKGWQRSRFLERQPATALKIGANGIEILTTSKVTGNLHSQMLVRFRFWSSPNDNDTFLYLQPGTRITSKNTGPESTEDERLTLTLFNNPKPVYNNIAVSKGSTTYNAYNYGVPRYARAILVRMHVTATWASGAGMLIYQRGGSKYKGAVAHATWSSHGGSRLGMRTGSNGIVPVGVDAYSGQFVIERTEAFAEAIVHILGYYS